MATQTKLNRSYEIGGAVHQEQRNIDGTTSISSEVSLAAAKVGALTTRTDDNTGELTMATGHGISTGVKLDVYWVGGSRRGMTVGTVADLAVPIDGGAGDNLPADETAITAMVPTVEDVSIIGDNLLVIVASATAKAIVSIQETDGTERAAFEIEAANRTSAWLLADGATNPLATRETEKIAFSHGDSSGTKIVRLSAMY